MQRKQFFSFFIIILIMTSSVYAQELVLNNQTFSIGMTKEQALRELGDFNKVIPHWSEKESLRVYNLVTDLEIGRLNFTIYENNSKKDTILTKITKIWTPDFLANKNTMALQKLFDAIKSDSLETNDIEINEDIQPEGKVNRIYLFTSSNRYIEVVFGEKFYNIYETIKL